jgi:hypothetical protein
LLAEQPFVGQRNPRNCLVLAKGELLCSRLIAKAQCVFERFAKSNVIIRHIERDVAMLEERQNPFDPSGTLNRLVSPGALRSGALASRVYRPFGRFGL